MGGPTGPYGLLYLPEPGPLPIRTGSTGSYGLQGMSKPAHLSGRADGPPIYIYIYIYF